MKKPGVFGIFARIRQNFTKKMQEIQSIQGMIDYSKNRKHDVHQNLMMEQGFKLFLCKPQSSSENTAKTNDIISE